MNLVYLLLGSNTGDRPGLLHAAVTSIDRRIGKIISLSSVYETAPWGNTEQSSFLNQVVAATTTLSAVEVLKVLLEIEKSEGRVRIEKWAPRTLDIDILYYNSDIIVTKDLKVPHAEMHNRKFTLVPLTEIAPDFIHPVFNISNERLLERCRDTLEVKKI